MKHTTMLITLLSSAGLASCTSERVVAPSLHANLTSPVAVVARPVADRAMSREVMALDRLLADSARWEPDVVAHLLERRDSVSEQLAIFRAGSDTAVAVVRVRPKTEEPPLAEALNIIYKDTSFTYTRMTLDPYEQTVVSQVSVRPNSVYIVSGAILQNQIGGSATPTGGTAIPFTGGDQSEILTVVLETPTTMPSNGPNCFEVGGTATATTSHSARYVWQGLGPVLDTWATSRNGVCNAKSPAVVTLAPSVGVGGTAVASSNCTVGAVWGSSDPWVASVSPNGTVTGLHTGTSTITAVCFPLHPLGTSTISVTYSGCDASALIYELSYSSTSSGSCTGDTPGGGGTIGSGTYCTFEYIIIDVNRWDGTGWHTIWEGYTDFCQSGP